MTSCVNFTNFNIIPKLKEPLNPLSFCFRIRILFGTFRIRILFCIVKEVSLVYKIGGLFFK